MKYENHPICLKSKNLRKQRYFAHRLRILLPYKWNISLRVPTFSWYTQLPFLALLPLSCTFQKVRIYWKGMGVGVRGETSFYANASPTSLKVWDTKLKAHQFKPVSNEDNLHSWTAQKGLFICPHLSSHIRPPGHPRLRQQYASFPLMRPQHRPKCLWVCGLICPYPLMIKK